MRRLAKWRLPTTAGAALLLAGATAGSETYRTLRFDPFARPDLDTIVRAAEASGAPLRTPDWSPVVAATLVAGDDSLANLGGVVLRIGEETHGYRLKQVRQWEAVFDRNGETIVLAVEAPEGAPTP